MARYKIIKGEPRFQSNRARILGHFMFKYRIEKLILWPFPRYIPVNYEGKPFHHEHFGHGNDYVFYNTMIEAENAISEFEHTTVYKPKSEVCKTVDI